MKYPSFVDDQSYMEMDSSVPEAEQLKAMLSNLTRVHLLTANKFDSFDSLIREYLISGIEVFGLETGIVSQVTAEGIYIVRDVVSPLDVLEKGLEFQLEDTYCREVIKSQQVLGFPEVGILDYMNCHPVYQNLKLEAYLSAPIFVGSDLYGTLNFTSVHPRKRGFSRHEHNLILLLAHSIGSFILLRNKEEKLVTLNQKMKRFVGYVAHDLRNPLGTIIGYARMGSRKGVSEERLRSAIGKILHPAEQALEFVSTILESAAISTGKLSLSIAPLPVQDLLEQVVESVSHFAEECGVSFVINCDDYQVEGDAKRLSQSITNLLINAVKYSPRNSQVLLEAQHSGEQLVVSLENSIDAQQEGAAQKSGEYYGSVGFGLDIVSEVLLAHHSELILSEKDGIYRAEFSLPLVK
ncbi:Signal transduction histidine kinase [Alteromonadaceae bacterium Bs31]|nr:Signal transduction histidine kinase [Alteromonadaceae bacterium Bs31]